MIACVLGMLPLGVGPACAALTPSDAATIETTGGVIAQCQAREVSCMAEAGTGSHPECYALYDACMADAGER